MQPPTERMRSEKWIEESCLRYKEILREHKTCARRDKRSLYGDYFFRIACWFYRDGNNRRMPRKERAGLSARLIPFTAIVAPQALRIDPRREPGVIRRLILVDFVNPDGSHYGREPQADAYDGPHRPFGETHAQADDIGVEHGSDFRVILQLQTDRLVADRYDSSNQGYSVRFVHTDPVAHPALGDPRVNGYRIQGFRPGICHSGRQQGAHQQHAGTLLQPVHFRLLILFLS